MKTGRNDPCLCGSGIKYKKCCLNMDGEKKHEENSVVTSELSQLSSVANDINEEIDEESTVLENQIDQKDEKMALLFDDFQSKKYNDRIVIFNNLMDESELLDSEVAFDMLGDLFNDTVKLKDYDTLNGLLKNLKEKHQDIYNEYEAYNLDWWISNSLALGNTGLVRILMLEFANIADDKIDVFGWSFDRVIYHGHLSILLDVMKVAWPKIRDSHGIMGWAIDEYSFHAADFELFNLIEQGSDFSENVLKENIGQYINYDESNKEIVSRIILHLIGKSERQWKEDDFYDLKNSSESVRNLMLLSKEFIGELHRNNQMAFTKIELGRSQIIQYLVKRSKGGLAPRRSMMDAALNPNKPLPKQKKPIHHLCPDRETFDRFLSDSLHFINPQIYKAVACFELIPDWLQFLVSRRLVDEETHKKVLSNLRPMINDVRNVCSEYYVDPLIQKAIKGF